MNSCSSSTTSYVRQIFSKLKLLGLTAVSKSSFRDKNDHRFIVARNFCFYTTTCINFMGFIIPPYHLDIPMSSEIFF